MRTGVADRRMETDVVDTGAARRAKRAVSVETTAVDAGRRYLRGTGITGVQCRSIRACRLTARPCARPHTKNRLPKKPVHVVVRLAGIEPAHPVPEF